jgi:hypothetical protein
VTRILNFILSNIVENHMGKAKRWKQQTKRAWNMVEILDQSHYLLPDKILDTEGSGAASFYVVCWDKSQRKSIPVNTSSNITN